MVFRVEFFKNYMEELAPKLHSMLVHSLREDCLPLTKSDAVIVVVPKPGERLRTVRLILSYLFIECRCQINHKNSCTMIEYSHHRPSTLNLALCQEGGLTYILNY